MNGFEFKENVNDYCTVFSKDITIRKEEKPLHGRGAFPVNYIYRSICVDANMNNIQCVECQKRHKEWSAK